MAIAGFLYIHLSTVFNSKSAMSMRGRNQSISHCGQCDSSLLDVKQLYVLKQNVICYFSFLGWISRKVLKHGISVVLRYVLC